MKRAFVRFGHGYEVIAAPLGDFSEADRERRSWPSREGGPGTTYGSHALKLGKMGRGLYILVHHGAGREVLELDYGSSHAVQPS